MVSTSAALILPTEPGSSSPHRASCAHRSTLHARVAPFSPIRTHPIKLRRTLWPPVPADSARRPAGWRPTRGRGQESRFLTGAADPAAPHKTSGCAGHHASNRFRAKRVSCTTSSQVQALRLPRHMSLRLNALQLVLADIGIVGRDQQELVDQAILEAGACRLTGCGVGSIVEHDDLSGLAAQERELASENVWQQRCIPVVGGDHRDPLEALGRGHDGGPLVEFGDPDDSCCRIETGHDVGLGSSLHRTHPPLPSAGQVHTGGRR